MLDTVSIHHESISEPIATTWGSLSRSLETPALNLPLVEHLARARTGSKRSAEPGSPEHDRKRTKTSNGYTSGSYFYYPDVPSPIRYRVEEPDVPGGSKFENIQILTHTLDIHFGGLSSENEPSMVSLLQELKLQKDSTHFLCGVSFVEHKSRLVAMRNDDEWLMAMPQVTDHADEDDDGASAPSIDLLLACDILTRARKAVVKANVCLVIDDKEDSSFRLQVNLRVSLSLPYIFYPLARTQSRKSSEHVADAQRRLLSYVYGMKATESSTLPNVNISYFYSALHAARPLPSLMADDAMQPELLKPTLLPFQRRSVGWLLHREGLDVTPSGEIVPNPSLNDFSFYMPITEANHTWHFNRLSGELYMAPPPPPPAALGGILAEEPGLGKTLEMISLILLHPPDASRNPTVTRWDPEARLNVKAIKTSLIVTPPALASQWADEIAAHAPTLKVLVYDGWSKLAVPITQTQLEEQRARKTKVEVAKEKSAQATAQRKKKGKGKAKETKAPKQKSKPIEDDKPDMTKDADGNVLEWCDYVQQFDVVITTYQVLRLEFNVARAPPVRPRREDVVYVNVDRPRSPLIMVEWNRVIMDEVQMVGGANLEDMVSLIPRLSSFAVSGTPARAQISDLIHVLKFLRVFDIIGSARLWKRLIKPGFAQDFSALFQAYTVRTTKASVKQELTIPQQTRYLVPIELGRIEQHVYDQNVEAVLLDLGLDARGVAATENWEVDGALLRSSIRKLRGICTHPQVGQLQKKGDSYKRGALKSMDAVLQIMVDQNWKNIMEDWKAKVQSLVRYAQLVQMDQRLQNANQVSLESLQTAEKEIDNHIKEINTLLADHNVKGEVLKKEAAAYRRQRAEAAESSSKAKAKVADGDADDGNESDDEEEDGEGEENVEDRGLPKTPAGKEHKSKTQALKTRLREGTLLLHRIKFVLGDVFHSLGKSAEEDAAYEAANDIRKGLLKASENDAARAMAQLSDDLTQKRFNAKNLFIKLPYFGQGGIRSAELLEEANELIEEVLNEQSALLIEWRSTTVNLLTQALTEAEDAETDGQEYQRNLDRQGEAEAYMQAYSALLADRREALINERTLLAAHDVREKKLRHTKAAMRAAAQLDMPVDDFSATDLQPEHELVYRELSDERKELLRALYGRSIKSVLVDLNAIFQRLPEKDLERPIITEAIADIRRLMTSQSQLHDKIDADLTFIRRAFNERILYFRQLQEISDSVAEPEWEQETLADALQDSILERADLDAKINTNRARHRYLVNLVNNKGAPVEDEDDEKNVCILCRCDFIRGFITPCAHIFCEGCMKAWLAKREGKTCPVCRVGINPDTVQRFTISPAEVPAPKQPVDDYVPPQSTRRISYNYIDPELFKKIEKVESLGDFGSKIQTLIQHLLYLQVEDRGAKSIVFSAWADSLHIVELALHTNGIRCLRIDQNSKGESAAKKFRTDPDILVLLLHGERENAGLNVTCASRVFLLESVVHHSFELQAIARIDRMGQTRPTEVYCYYAEDTVERNILDLAARNDLSLYTKEKSAGTLDLSSFSQENDHKVVDAPTKKLQKGDFIFKIDDMLAILFPHMFEEVEYLLPQEEGDCRDVEMADATTLSMSAPCASQGSAVRRNAVAGPSRSR